MACEEQGKDVSNFFMTVDTLFYGANYLKTEEYLCNSVLGAGGGGIGSSSWASMVAAVLVLPPIGTWG